MSADVSKLKPKQEEAVLALVTNRNVEEAAHAIKIAPRTLYRWLNEPHFERACRKARNAAYGQARGRLQQACSPAVTTILKVMVDAAAPASVRLRAADLILTHTAKAVEIEDLDARVTEIEESAKRDKKP